MKDNKIKVLFVCLGNICRSPMAEAVFARKAADSGVGDYFFVDSAGTGRWHIGNSPHNGTLAQLALHGISTSHRARAIAEPDFSEFDYIVTMDDSNYDDVLALGAEKGKVRRFVDFDSAAGYKEVPDPYYSGNFSQVYEIVDQLSSGLLKAIRAEKKI